MRSIAFGVVASIASGGSLFLQLFYIAIWFQAVKNRSPVSSGLSELPLIMGLTAGMIIAGQLQRRVNYIPPFMIISSAMTMIGSGLITTWTPTIGQAAYLGYQAIFGIGQGLGWQQPNNIAQLFVPQDLLPVGTTVMTGSKLIGGAIFLSVGSSLFNQRLSHNLGDIGPGLDVKKVLDNGAVNLPRVVSPTLLPFVKNAYNDALTDVFIISLCLSSVALIGSLGIEWKPITRKGAPGEEKPEPPKAPWKQTMQKKLGLARSAMKKGVIKATAYESPRKPETAKVAP
jgi:hypothetical protein